MSLPIILQYRAVIFPVAAQKVSIMYIYLPTWHTLKWIMLMLLLLFSKSEAYRQGHSMY